MYSVLIIDDEEKLRSLLKRLITLEGFTVSEAGTLQSGLKLADKTEPDIILCDVKLPDGSGVDFVKTLRGKHPETEVILLTAYGNIADGVQAMKNGAFDYITKGDDNEKILPLLQRASEQVKLRRKLRRLQQDLQSAFGFEQITGDSPLIQQAIHLAKQVAPSSTTVLLLGETGTGKEVFARALHQGSLRRDHIFLALNCSAFGQELLESEIFGHKAGAFTGALKDKRGLVEEANGGTLFLDEIGEMPSGLQSKLLRFLETGEFIKVGDTQTTKVDVRLIAATNRDLPEEIKKGHFREDLYYRLNVFAITLPPLRERKADIPALAMRFLDEFSQKTNKRISSIDKTAMQELQGYAWPGNIRELKNAIERAVILSDGDVLPAAALPAGVHAATENASPLAAFSLARMEKEHIAKILQQTGGNKTEAARLLQIGLTTLYRKMEEYKIQ